MVEQQLPKLNTRVRFPSPAPTCPCQKRPLVFSATFSASPKVAIGRARRPACGAHGFASPTINGLFVGIFFLGGALGSALAGTAWDFGGWVAVCAAAAGFGAVALITGLAERR